MTANDADFVPNILIVDDTPENLNVLSSLLDKQAYLVRPAISAQVALTAIDEALPDLILLDIRMPEMDGYTLCQQLKSDPTTKHIPVIFISALNDTDDIVQAFEAGGVDYITKPFRDREVLARVGSQLTVIRQHRQMIDHFEYLQEMRETFLQSATHDLKNPLSVIMGYSQMLENVDGADFEQKVPRYLERINRAAGQMLHLVTDMLDLAKVGTGVQPIKSRVALNPFVEDIVHQFELQAQDKGLELHFSPAMPGLTIYMDETRMLRVFENLISNAIKYTPSGGSIWVSITSDDDGTVRIAVRDTGLGIPEDAIEHLFGTFYRVETDEHLQVEGTGLGLAIVKSFVEQHNGSVEVTSTLGEGSEFTVVLFQAEEQ